MATKKLKQLDFQRARKTSDQTSELNSATLKRKLEKCDISL